MGMDNGDMPQHKKSETTISFLDPGRRKAALRFVLLIGIVSLFADCTYEGSRSITGQFLGFLGANATVVGFIAGLGELLGYGLRVVSGRLSERTRGFWPITLIGYFIQMTAVPLLALSGNWQIAALLIVLERIGKATRNPPRDVMLSYAAKEMGYGWGFGMHEALDQLGALIGPLVIAAVLARQANFRMAFAVLVIPACVTLALIVTARFAYPRPENLEPNDSPQIQASGISPVFWIYLIGACFVAAGFADFQLIGFHFAKASGEQNLWIPVAYAIAMGVSGLGSLLFGKMFDRVGIGILLPLTIVSALFAPLVFLGRFWMIVVGSAVWGLGMGVHESIIPAAVAGMVAPHKRASAYGLFTAGYGVAWFLGSCIMGFLYDHSVTAVVIFCVVLQIAALPFFWTVEHKMKS
jgi:predicted MFS family arabinose efflux permease